MTWHEVWDVFVLVMQLSLLVLYATERHAAYGWEDR